MGIMVSREKEKELFKIIEKAGRIQSNKLVNLVEEKGIMSHQTARNVIKEGVKSRKIIREEEDKKNSRIVWYSISSDIGKAVELLYQGFLEALKNYDAEFSIFKEKFPHLSTDERADGVDVFHNLLVHLAVTAESLGILFGQTTKWVNLLDEIKARGNRIKNELEPMCPQEEQVKIALYLLQCKSVDIDTAFGDVKEFIEEIK